MSRETFAKTDDGVIYSIDNLSTQKWLEGQPVGLDACVNWINEKAAQLFIQRQTSESLAMQSLADELKETLRPALEERAKTHKVEFPSQQ